MRLGTSLIRQGGTSLVREGTLLARQRLQGLWSRVHDRSSRCLSPKVSRLIFEEKDLLEEPLSFCSYSFRSIFASSSPAPNACRFRVWILGCEFRGLEFVDLATGFGVWGLGCGAWCSGFGSWGLGCMVWVWGLGRMSQVMDLRFLCRGGWVRGAGCGGWGLGSGVQGFKSYTQTLNTTSTLNPNTSTTNKPLTPNLRIGGRQNSGCVALGRRCAPAARFALSVQPSIALGAKAFREWRNAVLARKIVARGA